MSELLVIFTAMLFVVALQLGAVKNDTSAIQDNLSSTEKSALQLGAIKNDTPAVQENVSSAKATASIDNSSDFWFSFVGAIGSAATAAALVVIIYQTWLTRKQMAQTQKEVDSTLRPWLGVTQVKDKDIGFYVDSRATGPTDVTAEYFLKNYGRVPARIISKRYKWSKKEISEEELYSEKIPDEWTSSRLRTLMFPDENAMSKTVSDKNFLTSSNETFYFGLLIEYDSGEGTRKRELGSIFTASRDKTTCIKAWTE